MNKILAKIGDCAAVFVAKVGDGPAERLAAIGVQAVDEYAHLGIEDSLRAYSERQMVVEV